MEFVASGQRGLPSFCHQRRMLSDPAQTAADPAQRRTWVAPDGVLDQGFKRSRKARLMRHRTLAPSAAATNPGSDLGASDPPFPNATVDGAAGQTGCNRLRADAAVAACQCLIGVTP